MSMDQKDLIKFYLGECPDISGRLIEDIWSFDNEELEYIHDYIQWLFPLREKSQFNSEAPLLDEKIIQQFRNSAKLRQQLVKSLKVMLKFYGFECIDIDAGKIKITKSLEYPKRRHIWLNLRNHNYLRITRILKCLNHLGLETYAQAFFQCLEQIYKDRFRDSSEANKFASPFRAN